MASTAVSGLPLASARPCIASSSRVFKAGAATLDVNSKAVPWTKLASARNLSQSLEPFRCDFASSSVKFKKVVTKAMSESSENKPVSGLPIDLKGKRAFIAGVADDNGYGWAIAKSLAAAGAEILVGSSNWTVKEVAESVKQNFGSIDILVHSLANGPEVSKPLLETSRNGYLAALSASSYSYVSLLKHFVPLMNPGMSSCGYGGGMSSAKAALESDTRVLAFEAGRKHKIRVNTISAGPLRSAAKAIGFIDTMIEYSIANAPLRKELSADEVGNAAALSSPLASAITGAVIYVDNGLNVMGIGVDSPIFKDLNMH
ncbi:reductase [Hibiscus syriacus]|uniref:Reductase n=1 Tax=Hibiscus syriacus TaxID=106335 RepID=A0A6A3BVI1_HIBSY|nr:reductase [Hibiscus syriacus]